MEIFFPGKFVIDVKISLNLEGKFTRAFVHPSEQVLLKKKTELGDKFSLSKIEVPNIKTIEETSIEEAPIFESHHAKKLGLLKQEFLSIVLLGKHVVNVVLERQFGIKSLKISSEKVFKFYNNTD